VEELEIGKLSTALNAEYGSLHAARQVLGATEEIRQTFTDFQMTLYAQNY
jgi:hypothetical protein